MKGSFIIYQKKYQKNRMKFTVEFFEASSRAWMRNKRRVDHTYKYTCAHIRSSGRRCSKNVDITHMNLNQIFCKQHLRRARMPSLSK